MPPETPSPETPAPPVPETPLRREAVEVARILRRDGHVAYFAGGCVRDRLLGKAPKDYDIATSARPERVLALFPHTVPVGAQFGVVLVVRGAVQFEVATFRSDGAYVDGRRPSAVYFGSAEKDAQRRDFTCNGLFEDPETGEILDFVGGRSDLGNGVIRAIGEPWARFDEDKLRLLRAVRFAAQLGFRIEEGTFRSIREHAQAIEVVAKERILLELTKTITARHREVGLALLKDSGLLRVLLPEVAALEGVPQPPEYHPEGECFTHQLLVMRHLPDDPPEELAWAALLHDVGKPGTFKVAERIRFDGHAELGADMSDAILTRLKASKHLRETVRELVADHQRFADVPRMRESTLKRFLRREHVRLHLALHKADCLASHGKLDHYELCMKKLLEYEAEASILKPVPLVTGRDLMALGYRPGPRFKEILEAVETAQLEGELATPEDAVRFVRERFPA